MIWTCNSFIASCISILLALFVAFILSSYLCRHKCIIKSNKMTEKELLEIVAKEFYTEVTKACIRRDYPPHIAWRRCNFIDITDAFARMLRLI